MGFYLKYKQISFLPFLIITPLRTLDMINQQTLDLPVIDLI